MARKMFGGKLIRFVGRNETLEEIFGKEPLSPPAMNKIIWAYIKKNELFK